MPAFRIPIEARFVDPDPRGPIRRLLRASIRAEVQLADGAFTLLPGLIFDSGANYTVVSATRARLLGIAFPVATSRLGMTTTAGSRSGLVHDGELRLRFPQLPGRVFRLYCVFSEDVPPNVPPVLGLNDTLDTFRVGLDGTATPDALGGAMTFETL